MQQIIVLQLNLWRDEMGKQDDVMTPWSTERGKKSGFCKPYSLSWEGCIGWLVASFRNFISCQRVGIYVEYHIKCVPAFVPSSDGGPTFMIVVLCPKLLYYVEGITRFCCLIIIQSVRKKNKSRFLIKLRAWNSGSWYKCCCLMCFASHLYWSVFSVVFVFNTAHHSAFSH